MTIIVQSTKTVPSKLNVTSVTTSFSNSIQASRSQRNGLNQISARFMWKIN